MGIPDHLACLLRNLYVYQEEAVRNGHETTDWFQNGKGEAQGRIKISGRTINNLKYADDITLMAEIKEELKRLLIKVKDGVKKLA